MILELATVNGKTIGWRISGIDKNYLIFADQKEMPGVRIGDKFVPGLNDRVEYQVVYDSNAF